jgi:hypothetical protein
MTEERSSRKEERLGRRAGDFLREAEVVIYYTVAVLLAVTAAVSIASAGHMLWNGIVHWTMAAETLRVLDQLLIVLMVVEILHTVRISIRSHILLATEPFLVVGLIASMRRVLVISMQMSTLTKEGKWSADGTSIFRASMLELALLVVFVLVLVFSITLLRRYVPTPKDLTESLD